MKVYHFPSSDYYIWYSRRARCWYQAPGHALDTAHANAGWQLSDYAAAQRIPGYLVTPARPELIAAVRPQRKRKA